MSEELDLRPYQKEVLDYYRVSKKSFLVQLPTGSGKSVIMREIIRKAHEEGLKILMIVRGKSLVHQFCEHVERVGLPYGIIQESSVDHEKTIQVASIDTLSRRLATLPKADLILVDEAHLAVSASWIKTLKAYVGVRIISFTATPYRREGLEHLASEICRPAVYSDLVKEGFLAPPRYFLPLRPDLSEVRVEKGEYVEKDLMKVFSPMNEDVIDKHKKHLLGIPTLCFAINLAHAKRLVEDFDHANFMVVIIDQSTSVEARKRYFKDLEEKRLEIIVSVGTLTTGVDLPCVGGILIVRPTLSKSLHIQMIGRGSRLFPGKKSFKVIDLAGNIERHGFIENAPLGTLKPTGKRNVFVTNQKSCPSCDYVVTHRDKECPNCAFCLIKEEPPKEAQKPIEYKRTKVVEIKDKDFYLRCRVEDIAMRGFSKGYKQGWVFYEVEKILGAEAVKKFLPYSIKEKVYDVYVHKTESLSA